MIPTEGRTERGIPPAQLGRGRRASSAIATTAVLVAVLTGCRGEGRRSAEAIWSDTNESWLVKISVRREETCGVDWDCETRSVPIRHAIWIYPADGGDRRRLVARDGGAAIRYFMESAGYVLLERNGSWERLQVDGSGDLVEVVSDGLLLPSPDGSVIAHYVPTGCADAECPLDIRFLDAATLEPIGEGIDYRWEADHGGVVWAPEGDHLYFRTGSDTAFRVSLAGEIETGVEPPSCDGGVQTTSSQISADGRRVEAEILGGNIEIQTSDTGGPGWPEICWPSDG